jgi:hypothetical protein
MVEDEREVSEKRGTWCSDSDGGGSGASLARVREVSW